MKLFILFSILLCIFMYLQQYYSGHTRYTYNGQVFYIKNTYSEKTKKQIAEILHELKKRSNSLVQCVEKEKNYKNHYGCKRLIHEYKNTVLQEIEPTYYKKAIYAYNVNKGDEIHLCIKEPGGDYNTVNEMMFVLMHEMAHIMTKKYDHNEEFWENFRILIKIATQNNLYINHNYGETPKKYCGNVLTHNPYYDRKNM